MRDTCLITHVICLASNPHFFDRQNKNSLVEQTREICHGSRNEEHKDFRTARTCPGATPGIIFLARTPFFRNNLLAPGTWVPA